jgi:hypothetical protein
VFIASRSPASLVVGEIGDAAAGPDGTYDPTRLSFQKSIPLSNGASGVFVAPIVDRDGLYALRVFVVCFDSRSVWVYDPDRDMIENVIHTGDGPFALTFDPFDLEATVKARVRGTPVDMDPRYDASIGMRRYRFAYLSAFTNSYVQIIDLDGARAGSSTFETIVYTLGIPTPPKGTKQSGVNVPPSQAKK